jgi:hypothetical protein
MPQLDSLACSELAGLPAKLAEAITAAEMPRIGEGPYVKPLTELLTGAEISDSGLFLACGETVEMPKSQASLCLSGLWLLAGDLDRSHSLSQELPCRDGSFWHGIMHRREGDFGNAKYWFRKVGPHPVFDRLSDWGEGEYENPFDFVDECRHAEKNRGGEAYQRCLLAQWAEWQALMAHCLAP